MPCSAIIFLLAVTTDLPAASDFRTHSPAGCSPPANSTTMSGLEPRTCIEVFGPEHGRGDPGDAFAFDSAVEDAAQRHALWRVFHKMRATELPTVPKPKIATFIGRSMSSDTTFSQTVQSECRLGPSARRSTSRSDETALPAWPQPPGRAASRSSERLTRSREPRPTASASARTMPPNRMPNARSTMAAPIDR